jgi:hypothetical protein
MDFGLAKALAVKWATDARNTLIMVEKCKEGTLASQMMKLRSHPGVVSHDHHCHHRHHHHHHHHHGGKVQGRDACEPDDEAEEPFQGGLHDDDGDDEDNDDDDDDDVYDCRDKSCLCSY